MFFPFAFCILWPSTGFDVVDFPRVPGLLMELTLTNYSRLFLPKLNNLKGIITPLPSFG